MNNNNNKNSNKKNENTKFNLGKSVDVISNQISDTIEDIKDNVTDITDNKTSNLMFILKIVLVILALIAIYYVGRHLIKRYQDYALSSPYLMDKTKNGKHALVISQDPESVNYIPIQRSEDRENGIEFTYDYWMLIENFDYKNGEWKHLFHKGNSSSYPNRGSWCLVTLSKNIMRIYMNTQDNILEYVDVENLPLRKWIHVSLILKNKALEVYINGYLKSRKNWIVYQNKILVISG